MFDSLRDWWQNRKLVGEVVAWQRVEKQRDAIRFVEILERLEAARAADQREGAFKLWNEIRDNFYVQAVESPRLFKVVLDLHLYDDAEALMRRGLARNPRKQFYLVGSAQTAELRGDIPTALERWSTVRKTLPYLIMGYARAAGCLAKLGRLDEAEKMLEQGIARSPKDVFCLMEYAKIAESRGDFEEALIRWQHLRDVQDEPAHPLYQNGTIGLSQCLHKMGRLDEAEAILVPFMERFGVQEATLMELARIAEDRADTEEAILRWQRVTAMFPMMTEGYLCLIQFLKKMELPDRVDEVLRDLIGRFPNEMWPAVDYANFSYGRGDLEEIAKRWTMVAERFPTYEKAFLNAADALIKLGRTSEAEALRAEHARLFPA